MLENILIGVLIFVATGLLCWGGTLLKRRVSEAIDRHMVYKWLRLNTRDEPGESHVDIVTLAKGTRLTEDRVRKACIFDKRIYRSSGDPERWSVWRQEPQSVYEKRGLTVV